MDINLDQITLDTYVEGRFPYLEVKLLEYSAHTCKSDATIATFEVFIPRCILSEMNTHRIFSRNTGSTRAIPTKRSIQNIKDAPFVPFYFGQNKAGMQSKTLMSPVKAQLAATIWNVHRGFTLLCTSALAKLGLHKQWTGRLSEPHSYVRQVITSTSFDNFFDLRIHDDAQPEIVAVAYKMKMLLAKSKPKNLSPARNYLAEGWHLPYITAHERQRYNKEPRYLAKLSAARCARTSYLTQEGVEPNSEKELATFNKLTKSTPIHASPLEHQAYALSDSSSRSRNFTGFKQFREQYESQL